MLKQGDILRDRYKVLDRLGQGGMGAVYEAHDKVFDTSVALKEVILDISSAADTKAMELAQAAFEREAKILAKVNHETIPHVKDYFIEAESQFLIMELVDGDDLAKLLKDRGSAFPEETLLEWTDQLLDALDYLHNQQPPIIHRDIKPQNLKLTTRKKIKLLDFGIAKGTEAQTANTVTNQTFVAATLNYSPIEQMIRVLDPTFLAVITHKYGPQVEHLLEQNADFRTDIFALGATLYHLATYKHPAEAIKRGVDIWDGKQDPLENPRALNPELSKEFAEMLWKSMQINRDHRYANAAEMRAAVQQIMDVSTKQSLTPTVEMNFAPMTGDKTEQIIPVPSVPDAADETVQRSADSKPSEFKTEVLQPQEITGGKQNEEAPAATAAFANTGGAQTTSTEEPKKRSVFLWLLPVGAVLLFLFGGVLAGGAYLYTQMDPGGTGPTVTSDPTPEASPEESPEVTPEVTPTGNDLANNTPTPTPEPDSTPVKSNTPILSKRKPTPRPTRKATPRPVKKATPRRTPKKTPRRTPKPKKNMDCIFTDSCE